MYDSTHLEELASLVPACAKYQNGCFDACLKRPPTSAWARSRTRRAFDVGTAALILAVCAVPMLLLALVVRCTSAGPALFIQKRVGRWGRLFQVWKFRSMSDRHGGSGLSPEGDMRITPCGRVLRKLKLDELPQFYNVLKGDMSIVGPRPKLPQFAGIPNMPYRPGITGLATLAFRSEDQMLASVRPDRVESFYEEQIKPLKANLDVCYMCQATPLSDLRILAATAAGCVSPVAVPRLPARPRPRRVGFPQPAVMQNEENSGD
jgi:lipopolysaccharide/colanic/teichoic acid biosynthesis glycosyltransferase